MFPRVLFSFGVIAATGPILNRREAPPFPISLAGMTHTAISCAAEQGAIENWPTRARPRRGPRQGHFRVFLSIQNSSGMWARRGGESSNSRISPHPLSTTVQHDGTGCLETLY